MRNHFRTAVAIAALLIASPAIALDQQEFFIQLRAEAVANYNRAVISAREAAADGNLDLTAAYRVLPPKLVSQYWAQSDRQTLYFDGIRARLAARRQKAQPRCRL